MTESKECVVCGATYYKKSNKTRERWAKSMFCGQRCAGQWTGEKNRSKRQSVEEKECVHCGALYSIGEKERPCDYKIRRFCSRACVDNWQSMKAQESNLLGMERELAALAVDKGREAHLFGNRRFEDVRIRQYAAECAG